MFVSYLCIYQERWVAELWLLEGRPRGMKCPLMSWFPGRGLGLPWLAFRSCTVRACVPWLFDREGDWNASSLHVPTFGVCYVFSCWRQGFCSDECLPVSRFCEDSCSTHVMWRQEDRLLKLYNFGLWEHIREHDPTEAARVLACRSFSSVASPRQALKSSCVGVAGYFPAMTMAVVSFWPCSANPRTISEVVLHFSSSLGTALHTWDIW